MTRRAEPGTISDQLRTNKPYEFVQTLSTRTRQSLFSITPNTNQEQVLMKTAAQLVVLVASTYSFAIPIFSTYQPIEQVAVSSRIDDLQFLNQWLGKPRVVGLGEATHGSKEMFQFKTRLAQYLILVKGARRIAIEANMAHCEGINRYVLTGDGNPNELAGC